MTFIPGKTKFFLQAVCIGTIIGIAASANADTQAAVLPNDLSCILQNKEDYRSQGDIITLNFETCPEPPTFRERLDAHKARAVFPQRNPDRAEQQSLAEVIAGPKILNAIIVTKKEFDCLLRFSNLIELDEGTGRLVILPEPCRELAE